MTTIDTPAEPSNTPGRTLNRPRSNEARLWIFMRLSGLVLLFLALVHFSITHIIHDVTDTDTGFVANRWDNPLWRIYDWSLLALGLTHGLNGVRTIINDYVQSPAKAKVIKALIFTLTGALFLYGTWTVITFKS